MKHFIISALLNVALFGFSFAKADSLSDESSLQLNKYKQAVWKIKNVEGRGTGFFIGENHLITNFHVVSNLLKSGDFEDIFLSQEGSDFVLRIKRVLALSALYDLALLETEEFVTNHLTLRESTLESNEDIFVAAYLQGAFVEIRKIGNVIYEDGKSYTFPVDHPDLHGASGGVVLDGQGKIVGVAFEGSENLLNIIKLTHLRRFVTGDIGTECMDSAPGPFSNVKTCIEEEVKNLGDLAEEGDFHAQYQLAFMYYYGDGVERNVEEAFDWYRRSAEQGHTLAQHELAGMYGRGEGITQSFQDAFYWYKRAAESHVSAQYELAFMYLKGEGTKRDVDEALYWMKRAFEQGFTLAQKELVLIYFEGKEIGKDAKEAFYWCKKSAEQGYFFTQYLLAIMYKNGEGTQKNIEKAFDWFEAAARQGHAPSQYELALMYERGDKGDRDLEQALYWMKKVAEQGFSEAQNWLQRVATEGNPLAQYELALMYKRGNKGIKQSFRKAYQWLEKAAEQGHAPSQYELALIYHEGRKRFLFRPGKNLRQAYYWLIEASKQGHAEALSKLTDMVCNNEGSKEDVNKAIEFFEGASEQEIPGAQDCLDHIRNKGIGVAGTGLIVVTGAEQAQAQESGSIAETTFPIKSDIQTGESISGLNLESNNSTVFESGAEAVSQTAFEVGEGSVSQAMSEADVEPASQTVFEVNEEAISQTAEAASEAGAELLTEVGASLVGEITADLALDWIPVVGFGKLGFEAVAGIHVLTGRHLTPFERAASGGGAILNLVGFGWLKNLKSLKHSKAVGKQAHKWISVRINGEQWAKLVHFVKEAQIEKARGYLKSFAQSIEGIGFKVQKRVRSTVRSTRKVFVRGGSSADELSETVVINMEEGLGVPGRLESDKLSRAVDPDKMSNPGSSKVYRTGNRDQMPAAGHGVFVRTPGGDKPLDYNNPEVLRWLREAELPQRQSLGSLINKGTNRAVGDTSAAPRSLIKSGVEESSETVGFDMVL